MLDNTDTSLLLVSAADVVEQPVTWLWPYRIPLGELTVLGGVDEIGKTHIACDMAARVSTGNSWPDGGSAPKGRVLIAPEDNITTTIKPRLRVAGADLGQVFFLPIKPTLEENLEWFKLAISTLGDVKLLILDPIAYLLSKGTPFNNNDHNAVSERLRPIQEIARETGVAIVAITKGAKNANTPVNMVAQGNVAYTSIPRAVHLAIDHKLYMVESNLALKPQGLNYSIVSSGDSSKVAWQGFTSETVEEVFARVTRPVESGMVTRKKKQGDRAKALINELLKNNGAALYSEIKKRAAAEEISTSTLYRAKDELGVRNWTDKVDGEVWWEGWPQ